MNSEIVFETLVYRIGLVAFSILNSVIVVFLFKRRSRRLALALPWLIIVFMVFGIIGLELNFASYHSPYSKQVADVLFAQSLFLMTLNYVARSFNSPESESRQREDGH